MLISYPRLTEDRLGARLFVRNCASIRRMALSRRTARLGRRLPLPASALDSYNERTLCAQHCPLRQSPEGSGQASARRQAAPIEHDFAGVAGFHQFDRFLELCVGKPMRDDG